MRWRSHKDYHGTRGYDADSGSGETVSQFRITLAWLLDGARRYLQSLLTPSQPAKSATIMLKMGSARGFTMLGLPDRGRDGREPAGAPCASSSERR